MWGFQSTQVNRVVRVGGEGRGEGFDAIIAGVGSVGKAIILGLFRLFSHNSRDLVCNLLAISEILHGSLWDSRLTEVLILPIIHHSLLMIEIFATLLFNANVRFALRRGKTRSLLSRKNPPERFT